MKLEPIVTEYLPKKWAITIANTFGVTPVYVRLVKRGESGDTALTQKIYTSILLLAKQNQIEKEAKEKELQARQLELFPELAQVAGIDTVTI